MAVSNLIFQPSPIIFICCGSLIPFLFQIDPGAYCITSDHCSEEYSICDLNINPDYNECTGGCE